MLVTIKLIINNIHLLFLAYIILLIVIKLYLDSWKARIKYRLFYPDIPTV